MPTFPQSCSVFLKISSLNKLVLPLGVALLPLWEAAFLSASRMSSWYPLRLFSVRSTSLMVEPPTNSKLLSDCDKTSRLSHCDPSSPQRSLPSDITSPYPCCFFKMPFFSGSFERLLCCRSMNDTVSSSPRLIRLDYYICRECGKYES